MNPTRLVLPALRWNQTTGFAHLEDEIARAIDLGVGGFILFGGTASAIAALTEDATRAAGRPLLFAADLERGAGQQFTGLTQIPPPAALGALGDSVLARQAGRLTALEALSVGINWVLAPVADVDLEPANPIVQSRSFGTDPATVARMVAAWVDGCQSAGCLACLKHFPGHGRTVTDSHAELPVVTASADALEQVDAIPFLAGIEAGAASIMTAHVRFDALDPDHPATFSPAIIDRLRRHFGFGGLVVTDALNMAGATPSGGPGEAAVSAVRAGVDLLLYPADLDATAAALRQAFGDGQLSEERVRASLDRYERVLVSRPTLGTPERGGAAWAESVASRLLAEGMHRGAAPTLTAPLSAVVVDDDLGGPYPPGPTDHIPRLLAATAEQRPPGSKVLLVFASPRGWKGRAGLSEASRQAIARESEGTSLVVLFGHPRLVEEIPGEGPVLVAWHRQRLMQDTVLRWLEARAG